MRYLFLFFITTFSFAQQIKKVDFISVNASLTLSSFQKSIVGNIQFDFNVLSKMDTIKIDAQKMEIEDLKINNIAVKFKNSGKQLQLFEGFKNGINKLTFSYKATPKQTLYFIGQDQNLQIWTQGQGKYTSHWLPSFDDVNEKLIFNLDITFDKNFEVISNGILMQKKLLNNLNTWTYQMKQPMSSYLVMLAIGKFDKKVLKTKSGILLELYLKPVDKDKFESTYKHSLSIFDYFEKEIGVKYPWEIYRQVPVHDFLYAGMENTTATIFSQDFVVDEIGFNDRNYFNVNAHELAHQWFGDLITAESGKHHWLQEGFATYYALLAEKKVIGDNYFYHELLKMANELQEASKTDLVPVMNEKASSLSFYKKGAWALHILREDIGEKNFQKAVKNYLNKYKFKNVTTNDFLNEINKVVKYDTENFKRIWLEKPGFEYQLALQYLNKNNFIKELLYLKKQKDSNGVSFNNSIEKYKEILKSSAYFPVKQEVIYQIQNLPFEAKKEILQLGLETKDINVRQEIANNLSEIPLDFKLDYETLLQDNSYFTKQIALGKLWKQFPSDSAKYLDLSQNWIGFNNKDLRISWLVLALQANEYQENNKINFYKELLNYTQPNFDSTIRQNAMEALLSLYPKDKNFLKSLVNACLHHKWQMVRFGKENIRLLLKNENYRILFQEILPELNEKETNILQLLLNEKIN